VISVSGFRDTKAANDDATEHGNGRDLFRLLGITGAQRTRRAARVMSAAANINLPQIRVQARCDDDDDDDDDGDSDGDELRRCGRPLGTSKHTATWHKSFGDNRSICRLR
jgi:hypothetical protein